MTMRDPEAQKAIAEVAPVLAEAYRRHRACRLLGEADAAATGGLPASPVAPIPENERLDKELETSLHVECVGAGEPQPGEDAT